MKNFALLDENNKVINISIADDNWDSIGWVEYTELKPAGMGYTYDSIRDAFIAPKCHNEAVLDEATCRWICINPEHDIEIS